MYARKRIQIALFAVALQLPLLAISQDRAEKFVGTWSNQWRGGTIGLVITRNGTEFIVKQALTTNGAVLEAHAGKLQGENLSIPTSVPFPALALSEDESRLIVLNSTLGALPDLRRIDKLSPTK